MVSDVDTLTMRPRKFIAQLYIIASILYSTDKQRRLKEYKESIFTEDNIVKITLEIFMCTLTVLCLYSVVTIMHHAVGGLENVLRECTEPRSGIFLS